MRRDPDRRSLRRRSLEDRRPCCAFARTPRARVVTGTPAWLLAAGILAAWIVSAGTLAGELVVHYHRPDARYERWNVWAWLPGAAGSAHALDATDGFGAVARIDLPDDATRVGFLVRRGEWERKDVAEDRFVELDRDGITEIWLLSGDPTIHLAPPAIDPRPRPLGAYLDRRDEVLLVTSRPLGEEALGSVEVLLERGSAPRPLKVAAVEPLAIEDSRPITLIRLADPVADEEIAWLGVRGEGFGTLAVLPRGVLDDPAFLALDARLAADCTPTSTRFATWSPTAERVELLLLDRPDGEGSPASVPLLRAEGGVWQVEVPGDLHGERYRYRFLHRGTPREAPDIHAFAATPEGDASIVVDLDRVAPEGFGEVPAPRLAQPTDEVIYEIHVRDFSIADPDCPPAWRGRYLGLTRGSEGGEGDADGVRSGLAHLRELGITAVHLLPVHDFDAPLDSYNWGYWTSFFNAPETTYAVDRRDPLGAIRELRAAVAALHAAGIRVILDVVYNHTSSSGDFSPFERTVPGCYFRTSIDGTPSNDAGVGNSIADERPMVRKFILDSLEHWMREYRIDGVRIDLLGTHEPETARAIVERIRSIRPDATIYGEPWTGGGRIRFGKGSQREMNLAVFNDHFRNALRGDLDGTASGFANGPGGDRVAILRGAMGSIDDFATEPIEVINYVSAHDNLTLLDKIRRAAPGADDATVAAMQKLSIGLVLVAQGIPFLEGGSEICRTKGGDHNSYVSGDAVNQFDWSAKAACDDLSRFVAGLVAFRRAHPALRMTDDAMIREAVRPVSLGEIVAWRIDGRPSGDLLEEILVLANGEPRAIEVGLPRGEWSVFADAEGASASPRGTLRGAAILPAYSMLLLGR